MRAGIQGYRSFLKLIFVMAMIMTGQAASAVDYYLVHSLTSDRAGQLVLNGAIVEGNLYGRVLPETSDIDRIQFYLDGSNSSFKSESLAPYELNGGGSQARAYDTTDLSDGVHIIRTDVRLDNGDIISFDTQFTVANDAPPVNTAPVLNAIGNQNIQAGSSASINISSSDAQNDTRTFSTTGLPSYANFTDNGNGTATLSINPQAANVGTANLRVSVSDGEFSDFE
ncbi:MAG: hypothetical protein AB8D52_04185, partial [Gammaproteobacteria bacterium]